MNNYDMEEIGSFIAERRRLFGYTQSQLADKVNASFKTVSKWETGHSFPDLTYQVALCRVLKISLEELHTGKINKAYRIKNVLIKVLLTFFALIAILLIPAFIYLLSYYNKSYDSFKTYGVSGTTDGQISFEGIFFEYYKYNILLIDYSIYDKDQLQNKNFSVDLYYNDVIIYHTNKTELDYICIDKQYKIDDKWSYKISVNNSTKYVGNIKFYSNNSSSLMVKYNKKATIETVDIKKLKKNGFDKTINDEYKKVINKNEYIIYHIGEQKLCYHLNDGKLSYLLEYLVPINILNANVYYTSNDNIVLVERFNYYNETKQLVCLDDDCPNSNLLLDRFNKYISPLLGE